MAKETVEVLIQGGKATAAPPLGPALGPKGVNIGQVVADINKKTADFAGMQVPVKVIIDSEDKSYKIEIGTPPASALIMQEAKIKKGSGKPESEKVGNLTFEQIIKITRMKEDALLSFNLKSGVLEILGTCFSMGVTVEGKMANVVQKEVKEGLFDSKLK